MAGKKRAAQKPIEVIQESETGRNQRFKVGEKEVPRDQLVEEIRQGQHPDYHNRNINGVDTPCRNPDGDKKNNLG